MTSAFKKVITSAFVCTLMLFVGIGIFAATPAVANAEDAVVVSEEVTIVAEGNASYETWDEETGDYIYPVKWKLDSAGTLTIYGNGEMKNFNYWTWENQYCDTPWTQYRNQITDIVIEEGVTRIGNWAFAGLTNVTGELVLPESLQSIGYYSFAGCSGLSGDLVIPANVTYIESHAFGKIRMGYDEEDWSYNYVSCTGLTGALKFAGSVPSIGSEAFVGAGITAVELPTDMSVIPEYMFDGMSNLKSVELPANLTSIKKYAFRGTGLESIVIPDTVTNVGIGAFKNCKSLTTVDMSANTEYIRDYAFQNCSALTSIDIPGTVDKIGGSAFAKCTSMTTVKLNEGLTNIGNYAFSKCSSLTGIEFPSTLTRVGCCAFRYSYALDGTIEFPAGMTEIGYDAFYDCDGIDKVILNGTSAVLGDEAFRGCNDLKEVSINGFGYLHYRAFYKCTNLNKLTLGDGLKEIDNYAFEDCKNLEGKVAFPETITRIGYCAFRDCVKIDELVLKGNNAVIEEYAFYNCKKITKLEIGDGIKSIYYRAFYNCNNITGKLVLPESLTSVGDYMFAHCDKITEAVLPNSLTTIPNCMFYDCDNLSKVTFGDNVTRIENNAFSWCNLGGELVLPTTLEYIGDSAFSGNKGFTGELIIPDKVTYIGSSAFYSGHTNYDDGVSTDPNAVQITTFSGKLQLPEGLETIGGCAFEGTGFSTYNMPESVKNIGYGIFYGCNNITEVKVPSHMTEIPYGMFAYCYGLEEVTIPQNITSIGEAAFMGCYDLTKVTLHDKVTKLGYRAFEYCAQLDDLAIPKTATTIENRVVDDNTVIKCYKGSVAEAYAIEKGFAYALIDGADAENTISGSKGETLTWSINKNTGVLTVNTTGGEMQTFQNRTAPWKEHAGYIKKVVITGDPSNIGTRAFNNLTKLSDVTIPASVKVIGREAFEDCDKLKNITLPAEVEKIGYRAFYGSGLETITTGNALKEIGNQAFMYTYLKAIDLPDTVEKIGNNAFSNCYLTELTIPTAVTSLEYSAVDEYGYYYDYNGMVSRNYGLQKLVIKNRNCVIPEAFSLHNKDNLEIHGWKGSTAEKFAKNNGLKFVPLDGVLHVHSWGDKFILGEATCSEAAVERQLCTECGEIKDKEVNGTNHKAIKDAAVAATCTTSGLTEGSHCGKCGEVIVAQEIIPATGHTKVTTKATEATCTTAGVTKGVTCSTCGEVIMEAEAVAALGHKYVTDKAVAATCTESGYSEGSHCIRCGEVKVAQTKSKPLGHSYSKWTVTTKATCTTDGEKTRTCATCGSVDTDIILATDHSTKEVITRATTEDAGSITEVCRKCGVQISSTSIAAVKSVSLAKNTYTYNNKANQPKVTIKDTKGKALINGTDYTVTYTAGKNVGKHTATIKFKGEYAGKKVMSYTVNPKATTLKKPVAGNKQITVKWNKQATQTTGYQIRYSTNANFNNAKTALVAKTGTTSKVIKGLKAKTKYHVQVRTYKTVNGVKYFSAWSAKKTVKTK